MGSDGEIYHFGPFVLDVRERTLTRDDGRIPLTPKVFDTLEVLVRHHGRLIEKRVLMQEVWPDAVVEEANLTVCVSALRKVLGPDHIETVPKRGYRFVAPVQVGASEEAGVGPRPTWSHLALGRGAIALAALLVLVTGTVAWRLNSRGTVAPQRLVLAVLPFQNLSSDPEQDYIVDGLTEEVITRLGRLDPERLAVIARSSAVAYRGTKKAAAQVGRELQADYILEGSVHHAGERVRISTRLIQSRDGTHLWAQSYDRELSGIFEVQSEVAHAVADQIQLAITPQHQAGIAASRPANQDALEAYLRGRYFWNKRTQQALIKGVAYFREAIEKDPNYASAYSGLADSYIVLGTTLYAALPPKEAMPQAKSAAQKALTIDPTLVEAHTSVAFARFYFDWDWAAAETEFRRAIELNPNYSAAHQWYALLLAAVGRRGEALAQAKKGQELDPVSQTTNAIMGRILYYAGQHREAIERLQRTVELNPDSVASRVLLGLAYERNSNFEEAIAAFQTAADLSERTHSLTLGLLGQAYAITGNTRVAIRILEEVDALSKQVYVSPMTIALIHAGLRNNDEAFRWLEKAYEERSAWLVHLRDEPVFDTLRSDPRFADLVRRVGLP